MLLARTQKEIHFNSNLGTLIMVKSLLTKRIKKPAKIGSKSSIKKETLPYHGDIAVKYLSGLSQAKKYKEKKNIPKCLITKML